MKSFTTATLRIVGLLTSACLICGTSLSAAFQRFNILVSELDELMKRLRHEGRSVPGPAQANDVPVRWKSLR